MEDAIDERTQKFALADDIIPARQAATLWGLFRERIRRSPDAIAYRDYNRAEGGWRDHTWHTISERVDRFRAPPFHGRTSPPVIAWRFYYRTESIGSAST